MSFAITGAEVLTGEGMRAGLAVIVEGRFIADVLETAAIPKGMRQVELDGGYLAPGFIDVQVNGGGGVLLNGEPTPQGVRRIIEAHRRYGTTALLPTVITDAPEVMAQAIKAVRTVQRQGLTSVLGIHIEGPFIDPKRKGAHPEAHIREISDADMTNIVKADCGVKMLTLAPNRVPEKSIAELARAGVIVSLGHSDATAEEAQAALSAGARSFTHLFNAMSQMEGRAPGMVGAAFAEPDCFSSVIADGHHVADAALKAAFRAKGTGRVLLITDAMSSAAGGPDAFLLQGRTVKRARGRLQLEDGTLAGSDLTMDAAVRHCVNRLGLPLAQVLASASAVPAQLIGRDHELGRIARGYIAGLVHLSENLYVQQSWVAGEQAMPN